MLCCIPSVLRHRKKFKDRLETNDVRKSLCSEMMFEVKKQYLPNNISKINTTTDTTLN